MYKQINEYNLAGEIIGLAQAVYNQTTNYSIPYDTENSDYQTFKTQINNDSAQLENPEGVLIPPEEAKAYVATLP